MESVIAALLGLIAGALLKGAVDLGLEIRRERAQKKAALRLLGQDLLRALGLLQTAVLRSEWWGSTWPLASSAWESQSALLAARLDPLDWGKIAWAFYRLQDLDIHVQAIRAVPPPLAAPEHWPTFDAVDDVARVEGLVGYVGEAREVIERLLGEPFGGAADNQ